MPAYVELKLAWEMFSKAPDSLSGPERDRLGKAARQQRSIEERILRSPEAAGVVVPASTQAARLAEIRRRYGRAEDYEADLQRNGLTAQRLAEAVTRDLRVEAVLERVAARVPAVSTVDAEIFYRLHPQAFERPEARRLRHILITSEDVTGAAAARHTLEKLRREAAAADRFGAAALRHSHCPTALQGGSLGVVKRGQLHAELEPAAFALPADAVSPVLESPAGLHILRCDEVFAAGKMAFAQVRERIMDKLTDQRRRQAQRHWLAALPL